MKKILFSLIVLLIILSSIHFLYSTNPSSKQSIITNVVLNNQQFTLELAQTFEEKQQGLMYRESLPKNQGMIFIYNYESPKSFWMKNTLIPLDLIFLNSSSHIVDIKKNFKPCVSSPCEVYISESCQNVIEINEGLVNQLGLKIGDEIGLVF